MGRSVAQVEGDLARSKSIRIEEVVEVFLPASMSKTQV